ncbi:MAG TPA: pyrrolo-quinoline quinone [Candidatus Dormibacteraeota bacterium]|nr:pyrrolo-quinoline quinone [Candidatus Dormibacteraeota bacterium]
MFSFSKTEHLGNTSTRRAIQAAIAVVLASSADLECAQIATSQYNNMRTGATLDEKVLTPQNVNVKQFGKTGAFKVDGAVYAQPLFVPNVEIPGKGKRDVLFVSTEHASVYAFDAYRTNEPPLWRVSFLDSKRDVVPVSERDVQCPFIRPEVGITSTPVIDLDSGTLYVLARTMISHTFGESQYFQHLHALAITTGVEKFRGPKLIAASVPGRGDGAANGQVKFDPLRENPRASLLLDNGSVYLSWGSSCDVAPYHGWVMAYDAETLAQKAALNVTPDGSEGGIWASDTGPAVDTDGNIYVPTGNGTFDAASGGHDYGDSELKLHLEGSSLVIRDYFTPYDQARLNDSDADLGSGGPLLLPDQPGTHRHLLLQAGKGSVIYVIDRDQMGGFHKEGDAVVQRFPVSGGSYGAMAYWNGHVFFAVSDDSLRDYVIQNGQLRPSKASSKRFENPGATPSVSANGKENAIIWAVSTRTWNGQDKAAVLYAFDAKDIDQPIYTSEQNSARDRVALATRFVFPLVVNGHVYIGARGEVDVYGLLK